MDLFSMGVIDDPDRPKQHRPAPVRCYEDELAPFIPSRPKCIDCLHNFRPEGKTRCIVCDRSYRQRMKAAKRAADGYKRTMRVFQALKANGGYRAETRRNSRNLCEYVESGGARWATARDLRRLGLPPDERIAILTGYET